MSNAYSPKPITAEQIARYMPIGHVNEHLFGPENKCGHNGCTLPRHHSCRCETPARQIDTTLLDASEQFTNALRTMVDGMIAHRREAGMTDAEIVDSVRKSIVGMIASSDANVPAVVR